MENIIIFLLQRGQLRIGFRRWQILPDDQITAKRRGVPPLECRKASPVGGDF